LKSLENLRNICTIGKKNQAMIEYLLEKN